MYEMDDKELKRNEEANRKKIHMAGAGQNPRYDGR